MKCACCGVELVGDDEIFELFERCSDCAYNEERAHERARFAAPATVGDFIAAMLIVASVRYLEQVYDGTETPLVRIAERYLDARGFDEIDVDPFWA
jgi:hypothetical protein